ncbi:hypothetical protein BH10BAC2_BH10BAC2_40250 [soil metagenome]
MEAKNLLIYSKFFFLEPGSKSLFGLSLRRTLQGSGHLSAIWGKYYR